MVLLTRTYGEAGALDRFGPGPGPPTGVLGPQRLRRLPPTRARPRTAPPSSPSATPPPACGSGSSRASQVAAVDNSVGVESEVQGTPIVVCRGLRGTWPEVWGEVRFLSCFFFFFFFFYRRAGGPSCPGHSCRRWGGPGRRRSMATGPMASGSSTGSVVGPRCQLSATARTEPDASKTRPVTSRDSFDASHADRGDPLRPHPLLHLRFRSGVGCLNPPRFSVMRVRAPGAMALTVTP